MYSQLPNPSEHTVIDLSLNCDVYVKKCSYSMQSDHIRIKLPIHAGGYEFEYSYYIIPYHSIPCYTIPYHIIPYHTIPCYTIPYHIIPCISHHTIPYHFILYYTIPYYTIPYHTIAYRTIPYYTITYHTIHIIPYFIISYHTILHHTLSYTHLPECFCIHCNERTILIYINVP